VTTEGVDYSYGRPGGAALAAAGKHFAVRYVPYSGDGGKGLGKAELADLRIHGIDVALVFESSKGRALAGHAAGAADAQLGLDAMVALGFPTASTPIYFAVDFDATLAQQPALDAYLAGAAAVLTRSQVGVYGSASVVDRCAAKPSAAWFWQTYAWSAGRQSSHAHLYQYRNGQVINGAAVDFCRALAADFGQWAALEPSTGGPRDVPDLDLTRYPEDRERHFQTKAGVTKLRRFTREAEISPPIVAPYSGYVDREVTIFAASGPHGSGFLRLSSGGSEGDFILAAQVDVEAPPPPPPPPPDPAAIAAAVKAGVNGALDHVQSAHDAEGTAISEARIR